MDQSLAVQGIERLADNEPADSEMADQVVLGGQLLAGLKPAIKYRLSQQIAQLLVEGHRTVPVKGCCGPLFDVQGCILRISEVGQPT